MNLHRLLVAVACALVAGCGSPGLAEQTVDAAHEAWAQGDPPGPEILGACWRSEALPEGHHTDEADLVTALRLFEWVEVTVLTVSARPPDDEGYVDVLVTTPDGHVVPTRMDGTAAALLALDMEHGSDAAVGLGHERAIVGPAAALRPDGVAAFVGDCAAQRHTEALSALLAAGVIGVDFGSEADVVRSVARGEGPAIVPALEEAAAASQGPVWEDMPASERVVDPDTTPPDVFASFVAVQVVVEIPDWMRSLSGRLCVRTGLGWSECTLFDAGPPGEPAYLTAYLSPGDEPVVEGWLAATSLPVSQGATHLVWREAVAGVDAAGDGMLLSMRVAAGITSGGDFSRALDQGRPAFELAGRP